MPLYTLVTHSYKFSLHPFSGSKAALRFNLGIEGFSVFKHFPNRDFRSRNCRCARRIYRKLLSFVSVGWFHTRGGGGGARGGKKKNIYIYIYVRTKRIKSTKYWRFNTSRFSYNSFFPSPPLSFLSFHRFLFQSFNFFLSVVFSRLFVLHVEIETQERS